VFWCLDAIQSVKSPENVTRCSSDGDSRSDVVVGVRMPLTNSKEGRSNLYQGPVDPFKKV
jgi:hypothetical protein